MANILPKMCSCKEARPSKDEAKAKAANKHECNNHKQGQKQHGGKLTKQSHDAKPGGNQDRVLIVGGSSNACK